VQTRELESISRLLLELKIENRKLGN
jgi:hypothetical protein